MITSFHNEHRFLSNFWPCNIVWNWESFPSVEHAYQASKTLVESEHNAIRFAPTPGAAKRLGQKATVRSDWNEIKEQLMLDLVRIKFEDLELRRMLRATGNQALIEGNTWGDQFWGAVLINGQWVGQNKLGEILMDVRNEIRFR